MAPSATDNGAAPAGSAPARTYPPAKIYPVKEARFDGVLPPQPDGYETARSRPEDSVAIVIDNGSSTVRTGWSFETNPRLAIPPLMSKFRERKLGKTYTFAGNDCYYDATSRSHTKNAYELGTGIVTNWDVMEQVLDYSFIKMGLNDGGGTEGSVDFPIVMTEAVANLPYSRKAMTELIFECYGAPSLAIGIDSLFSYRHNKGSTGLVVSSGYSSTHVIPVYNSKALLAQAIRLNWGGYHAADYLLKLIRLKYPAFASKTNLSQAENMLRDYGYVSRDYDDELARYIDWTGLEDRDVIIQYPFTEEVMVQKSEEELARIAERKKESGRRLQEQAARLRLERLVKKEEELEYYKQLQARLENETKKEARRLLEADELKDEAALERTIRELERTIKKARTKDVGGDVGEEEAPPVFDLLATPDEELDEAGLKAKRQQRLAKANYDARMRAKAEKEAEKARIAEEKRLDEERRDHHRDAWIEEKRQARLATLQKIKDRDRLRQDLGNRKTLASQMRMKNIANLASDTPTRKRRRGGAGGDDDNFGANDDDWGVYRAVAVGGGGDDGDDEQEEEDLVATLRGLEQDLLQYDDEFDHDHTHDAQNDWSRSLLHAFARGPRPLDPGSQAELNQVHLNVERIRVPEVVFRPYIAGVDQAGLVDMLGDVLAHRLGPGASIPGGGGARDDFLRDVFLTGGNTLFRNFDERVRGGLMPLLPVDAPLRVRHAADGLLDAWRGAAGWAGGDAWRAARVTRLEYQEKGADYLKEHDLGNSYA